MAPSHMLREGPFTVFQALGAGEGRLAGYLWLTTHLECDLHPMFS